MSNSNYKGPFHLGDVWPTDETAKDLNLLQTKNKSFEQMQICKSENGTQCQAENFTANLTSSQATGEVGLGEFIAPALKCSFCGSNALCLEKKVKVGPGWAVD